jgi:hypothetical protein
VPLAEEGLLKLLLGGLKVNGPVVTACISFS